MQRCYHEGHDCDCSHEMECPVCREVTYDPSAHYCHPVALGRWQKAAILAIAGQGPTPPRLVLPRKAHFTLAGPRKGDA